MYIIIIQRSQLDEVIHLDFVDRIQPDLCPSKRLTCAQLHVDVSSCKQPFGVYLFRGHGTNWVDASSEMLFPWALLRKKKKRGRIRLICLDDGVDEVVIRPMD